MAVHAGLGQPPSLACRVGMDGHRRAEGPPIDPSHGASDQRPTVSYSLRSFDMAALNPKLADLSDDDRQVLESWLVEFDRRWDEGLLANRVDQIPPGSSWRLPALAEMVKIDLERQWQRGRQVSLESYLKEFPELGSPGDVSADLIQAEYEVRRQFGAPLTLEDYLRRFPHQAGELARLIAQGGSRCRAARRSPLLLSLLLPGSRDPRKRPSSSPNSSAGTGSSSGWGRAGWARSTWPRIPISNARWP